MSKYHSFYNTVDQIVSYGIEKEILHLYTGNEKISSSIIHIHEKRVLNFGSCSYLGLELDSRIKAGAIAAIEKFGTQFSSSRAYVSLHLYKELEVLLEKIFNAPCVITPTTTLAHIANIPVMIADEDAIIMDQQVHNSVQTAVQLVKARGVHIELVRHNRMDLLENRIQELRSKYKKIWYMADGIYSMFGDCTPIDEIYQLMDKYKEFHYYVDDAHGMSIHGKYGRGFVLQHHAIHSKMVMATSLNKAFACGGAVLVYGNKELARKVGTVGGPLLSSGPMQPSALGAAIASAKIHLSEEITELQNRLKDNIRFTSTLLAKYKLPVVSKTGAAIFFVGVSLPKLGHTLVRRMLDAGYYVNLGVFPTVPMKQTGIRFTITCLHRYEDIEAMIARLAYEFPIAMQEEQISIAEIYKAFKLPAPETLIPDPRIGLPEKQVVKLYVDQFKTIRDIDSSIWNGLFSGKGSFDHAGLLMLENSFSENEGIENNWDFDYLIVRNTENIIVAATFLTTTIWKDDMLSASVISGQVETQRKNNPYYMTSKVICTGSLITEGEHIYINKDSLIWKEAMQLLFQKIYALQDHYRANHIMLRDFIGIENELDHLMVENGFFRIQMPATHILSDLSWNDPTGFYHSLSLNARNQLRKKVLRNSTLFKIEIIRDAVSRQEMEYWYQLYLNVKNKSLELNTYALPIKLFYQLGASKNWEMVRISLSDKDDKACCILFCYHGSDVYIPMIIGLDYTYNKAFGIYRQALYQLVLRAKQLNKNKILLGFSASIEKQKLGAMPMDTYAYMHTGDSYNGEVLSTFSLSIPKVNTIEEAITASES